MGANCVADGKKMCQNDLSGSSNLTHQPQQMNEKIMKINNFQYEEQVLKKQQKQLNYLRSEEELDDYFIRNDELIEFDEVGNFPILNIACMQDLVNMNNHGQKDYIIEDGQKYDPSNRNIKNEKQYPLLHSVLHSDGNQRSLFVEQPLIVLKKPIFGRIIQQLVLIPVEQMQYSYNICKNMIEHNQIQYEPNLNQSQEIPTSTLSKSTNYIINSDSKLRKLTIVLNQYQFYSSNILLNLVSKKQYHVSFKVIHEKHKDLLHYFMDKVDSHRLSLQFKNIDNTINPINMQNLHILKFNLEGFNCSSNNPNFQQSLFYFFCSNAAQIKILKIKTRECSINYLLKLISQEIIYRQVFLTKISLDLQFFGNHDQDNNLLIEVENLIKNAVWIQKWNMALRFKQLITCDIAGEFERNSHCSLSESYLITQPKESFLQQPIEQSTFLSPIIKPRDFSPQIPHFGIRKVSFEKQNQININISSESQQQRNLGCQLQVSSLFPSNSKRPSNLKKINKPIIQIQNQEGRNSNKPILMLMQELRQNKGLNNSYQSHSSIQEYNQQGYYQIPQKSPDRLPTVTFAPKNELYYSLKNNHHQQMVGAKHRIKSTFLDTSLSCGIDFLNDKGIDEGQISMQPHLLCQIVKVIKCLSIKMLKKFIFIDQSNKIETLDLFVPLQSVRTLRTFKIKSCISDDKQLYAIQNIIKQNINSLKNLSLKLDKKIIVSVFDDQRLFNQIEKLNSLQTLILLYQTNDFLLKYIFKMKNLIYFKDLYKHRIIINKFNPYINNTNSLINLLKNTKLITLKTNQLQLNIPENIILILGQYLIKRKIVCQQFCLLRNYKIKFSKIYVDLSTFYL